MADQYQDVSWPGVVGVTSMSGTISHGIRPSTFVLTTLPQADPPAVAGDLVFSDRVNGVVRLRDCTADRLTSTTDGGGTVWRLEILDRRWRWAFGQISGSYNQTDTHGKLVPWTIRSPSELAALCLAAMGERGYFVDLPPGLPAAAGSNLDRFLRLGENFPQTLSNPPTDWVGVPPAEALARLADRYGRRVVFQPIANRVAILQPGTGTTTWPAAWAAESIAPSTDPPEAPRAVGVIGAPVRVQSRFSVIPVGEEWDGSFVPINELSYAPTGTRQNQISDVTLSAPGSSTFKLFIADQAFYETGTEAAAATAFAAAVNANADLATVCGAAVTVAGTVRLTGRGFRPFDVTAETSDPLASATVVGVQTAVDNLRSWRNSVPGQHYDVNATDRLSFNEAREKAVNTVWKCYRIAVSDPRGEPFLTVPGFGPIRRRQQIVLQPTKVEQVVPQARDKDGILLPAARQGVQGILPEFYNGYSRDQAATVTGSIAQTIGSAFWLNATEPGGGNNPAANTPEGKKIFVPFSVDPVEQMIVFSEPVYYRELGGTVRRPDLVLETGYLVQDPDTSAFWRPTRTLPVGGTADTEWRVFEDVEYAVVGLYEDEDGAENKLSGFRLTDFGDATARANTYLRAMANRYQVVAGETRVFTGLRPIDLDGSIQQVSWQIGPGGCTTTGSINSEHSTYIPPYPARRRVENLSPNAQAAMANLTDRGGFPNPADAVRARAKGLQ